jgi:long-chain acyl-CoA synthetase
MATRPIPGHAAQPPTPDTLPPEGDTFPKLVRRNAERMPRKVAIREKDLGIWQAHSWKDYFERSRLIALGLASLGFARGDTVAIVGDTRRALYWAVMAV